MLANLTEQDKWCLVPLTIAVLFVVVIIGAYCGVIKFCFGGKPDLNAANQDDSDPEDDTPDEGCIA